MTHIPVMLPEVLEALAPRDGATYLDATFGGGGYAGAILRAASCTLWAIDRDPDAISRGAALAAQFPGILHLLHGSFDTMLDLLAGRGVTRLDGVVMDLGLSSFQIDDSGRGFSFRGDGPLDMRMDRSGDTAGRHGGDAARGRVGGHAVPARRGAAVGAGSPAPSCSPGPRHRSRPRVSWPPSSAGWFRKMPPASIRQPARSRRCASG